MPYPERKPTATMVITVKERDIQALRNWARLEILADPEESVKEFLFEVYARLGEIR